MKSYYYILKFYLLAQLNVSFQSIIIYTVINKQQIRFKKKIFKICIYWYVLLNYHKKYTIIMIMKSGKF